MHCYMHSVRSIGKPLSNEKYYSDHPSSVYVEHVPRRATQWNWHQWIW